MLFAIDIDSTLGDPTHRLHHITGPGKKDYDAFYDPRAVFADPPIAIAQKVLPRIMARGNQVFFTSGRPERLRETTISWLVLNFGLHAFPWSPLRLRLRRNHDFSTADVLKEPWFKELAMMAGGQSFIVLDDDERVLKVAERHGLPLKAPECWSTLDY